jgi:FeS assembly SUF system protein
MTELGLLVSDVDVQDTTSAGDETSAHSALKAEVVEALKTVRDPEIPVNLVDLGLIYGVTIDANAIVTVEMTLTTPSCPVAGSLPGQVQNVVALVPGVTAALVSLVWEPPWTKERMTAEAALELGLL